MVPNAISRKTKASRGSPGSAAAGAAASTDQARPGIPPPVAAWKARWTSATPNIARHSPTPQSATEVQAAAPGRPRAQPCITAARAAASMQAQVTARLPATSAAMAAAAQA